MIRLSALGDVAMTVPVLLAFRRCYPDTDLLFITKSKFSPILERIPNLRVLPFHDRGVHKGLAGLWRLRDELKGKSFQKIADLHAVLRTKILKLFLLGSGKPFKSLDKGRSEKRRLTSGRDEYFAPLKSTHQRYADVFRQLGYAISLSPSDILPAEEWPIALHKEEARKVSCLVGLAPFAAHEGKCYPAQRIKEVIEMLAAVPGIRIYLFGGGPRETSILQGWEKEYPHCVSMAGEMSLSEELAVISNMDLMLSMDSGNGHLAAMYGVPVITVWGVTHPYAGFAPFMQPEENAILADRSQYPLIPTSVYGNRVPKGYENVMETIPPRKVCQRVVEVLEERGVTVPDSGPWS